MKLQPDTHNYESNDVVYTPRPLAKCIIDHFNPCGIVLDPCMGDGAFYDQFSDLPFDRKEWCEISKGKDFFKYEKSVDWIVSNPPYSLFRKFLLHSMEIADNIVYLITVNHCWTKARIRDLREHNFGIKEIFCVETPKNFPPSGFQYGAVHFQRGWAGNIKLSFSDSRVQPSLFEEVGNDVISHQ